MSVPYHSLILYKRMIEVVAAALDQEHPRLAGELNWIADGMEKLLKVVPR